LTLHVNDVEQVVAAYDVFDLTQVDFVWRRHGKAQAGFVANQDGTVEADFVEKLLAQTTAIVEVNYYVVFKGTLEKIKIFLHWVVVKRVEKLEITLKIDAEGVAV
jgi:hypothetical protein